MDKLIKPSVVRSLLSHYDLRADKGFGQNFLVDERALQDIVSAAELNSEDSVLEVGPGLGVLTRELAARAGRVTSVELDERLLAVLNETLQGLDNVTVVHEDGLEYDLTQIPQDSLLVANLPYNVATPLIVRALRSTRFKRLVFLVQREVAERLCAIPGSKAYGSLSLIVRHFADARRVRDVKPSAFFPPPEVTSSVVRLDVKPDAADTPELFEFIRTGFRHRRKTLRKNLQMAGFAATEVVTAMAELGLNSKIRAEALDLDTFDQLRRKLRR